MADPDYTPSGAPLAGANVASVFDSSTTGTTVASNGAVTGLVVPSGWSGTAITFNVGFRADALSPLYDEAGDEVSVTVAESTAVALPVATLYGWPHVQPKSDASETGSLRVISRGV